MKQSQLNAISRSYTEKRQKEALAQIEKKGLAESWKASGYSTPVAFLTYYKTPAEKAEKAQQQKERNQKQRQEMRKYQVNTVKELKQIKKQEQLHQFLANTVCTECGKPLTKHGNCYQCVCGKCAIFEGASEWTLWQRLRQPFVGR